MSEESFVDLYCPQVENLTLLFYRTVREQGGKTNHQPSGGRFAGGLSNSARPPWSTHSGAGFPPSCGRCPTG